MLGFHGENLCCGSFISLLDIDAPSGREEEASAKVAPA